MNNIVSLSGGKDSTAMLLMMLERKEPIHSVVFFDTGWEFPGMHRHIDKLKRYIWDKYQLKIWTLYPRLPFEYEMLYKPIRAKSGKNKGEVHRIGNGWPSLFRRWCTDRKVRAIKHYVGFVKNAVQCIGYAADEKDRGFNDKTYVKRFPLIEYGITEADALQYCYSKGFDWEGLYEFFDRVSCFCCPLQKIGELKKLRKYFPSLWATMLELDGAQPDPNRGFRGYKTVTDLDRRFTREDKQLKLFAG